MREEKREGWMDVREFEFIFKRTWVEHWFTKTEKWNEMKIVEVCEFVKEVWGNWGNGVIRQWLNMKKLKKERWDKKSSQVCEVVEKSRWKKGKIISPHVKGKMTRQSRKGKNVKIIEVMEIVKNTFRKGGKRITIKIWKKQTKKGKRKIDEQEWKEIEKMEIVERIRW